MSISNPAIVSRSASVAARIRQPAAAGSAGLGGGPAVAGARGASPVAAAAPAGRAAAGAVLAARGLPSGIGRSTVLWQSGHPAAFSSPIVAHRAPGPTSCTAPQPAQR